MPDEKGQLVTMYIKNRVHISKIQGLGSYQTLYLPESEAHRNRLLFIYVTVVAHFDPS